MITSKDLDANIFESILNDDEISELSKYMTHLSPSKTPLVWKSVHINDVFIGSYWLESSDEKVYFGFFLLPSQRGQGLGSKLLTLILEIAKSKGFTEIYLNVRQENLRAIRIYERFGFKPITFYLNKLNIPCIQYLKTDL